MKKCGRCKKEKDQQAFNKDKSRKDGLQGFCRECQHPLQREWHKNHREKIRQYNRKWRKNNRQKALVYCNRYYKQNKGKAQERNRKLFLQCLDHYGHTCALCGATGNLCMDHIGGNKGDSPKYSDPLWRWLIKNHFPSGFRTLCLSCNGKDANDRKKEKQNLWKQS